MDSHSPIHRIAGEQSLTGDQQTAFGWETFKREFNAPANQSTNDLAALVINCRTGRYRGASHPSQGYGYPR
jgi:hypothetical protein